MKQITMKKYKEMQGLTEPKRKGQTPEGKALKEVMAYAKIKGWVGGRVNTMGTMREGRYCLNPNLFLGFPDLVYFAPCKSIEFDRSTLEPEWREYARGKKQLVLVEVKSPKGKLSDNQIIFQQLCEQAGIRYIVARKAEDLD